jgi:ABC-2 type transport system ATP-binding protein
LEQQTPALLCVNLHKAFGQKIAVDQIDLSVPVGSFFGLVGPNGAGKTTLLSMATGLLRPDKGGAQIFGVDIWEQPQQAKELLGVLPDGMSLPERLTGKEVLTYLGLLRGLDQKMVADRTGELLEVLDLADSGNTLVIGYSTGMRKKIALATALLHNPKLLVLDEPFEAVDPVSAFTIKTILKRFVKMGGSVIFSSHMMSTVEQLCDSLAVIDKGRVRAAGSVDEVRMGKSLEKRFMELAGGQVNDKENLIWLAP